MRWWIACFLALGLASNANAEGLSNSDAFWALCGLDGAFKDDKMFKLSCAAYLGGAYDFQRVLTSVNGKALWCAPDYVAPQALYDITIKFMREHPEQRIGPTV